MAFPEYIKKYKRDLMVNATVSEQSAIRYFDKENIKFVFQKIIKCGDKYYIADFYFPKKKLILEIDGGYHDLEVQKEKDENRTKELERLGYKVVRMTNNDVKTKNYPNLLNSKKKSADDRKIKYGKYKGKKFSWLKENCPSYLKFLKMNHYFLPREINAWVKNQFNV